MTVNVFAVPVFFVVFRECLETAVIVSVLLAFLKQTLDRPNRNAVVYKKLVRQVNYICPQLIETLSSLHTITDLLT
jgi:high-affinity iron transporter